MVNATNSTIDCATADEQHRISRFLFEEAALLDDRRYRDWLGLFAESFEYRVPSRIHRQQVGRKDDWAVAKELSGEHDLPVTVHNRASLDANISRLETGRTITENPPWFTERLITNVVADRIVSGDGFDVRSCFLIQRYKRDREQNIAGHRLDRLVVHNDSFRIERRLIVLNTDIYRWSSFVFV